MKACKLYFILVLLIAGGVLSSTAFAQEEPPRVSPKATVSQVVGYTDVIITYSRPGVKGRDIWGGLVPYGEVWRTGANEATVIEFGEDVLVNGNEVPKGKYSLFTIPSEGEWTIVLNKIWDQWGAFNYDETEDLVRFKVQPEKSEFDERLLFIFGYVAPYSADVVLEWAGLKVSFTVDTNGN